MNQQVNEQLTAKRNELLNRINAIKADLQKGRSQDFSEFTTESENDEVLDEIQHEAEKELKLVNEALQRIQSNQYGECMTCGVPISTQRLSALPYATRCIQCAE